MNKLVLIGAGAVFVGQLAAQGYLTEANALRTAIQIAATAP